MYVITITHMLFFPFTEYNFKLSSLLSEGRTSACYFNPPHFAALWHTPLSDNPTFFSQTFPHLLGAFLHSPCQEWCSLSCFASLFSAAVTDGISRAGTAEGTAWGRTKSVIWLSEVMDCWKNHQNIEKKIQLSLSLTMFQKISKLGWNSCIYKIPASFSNDLWWMFLHSVSEA